MQTRVLASLSLPLLLFASTGLADKKADQYYEQAIRMHGLSNIEHVFDLYAKAAELGNPAAQYNIGMMYSNGEGVNVDYQQAVYWFRKSSDQNFAPAKFRLGEMYYFGMGGLPRNAKTAAGLFRHGAELGDADAQMNFAVMLGSGEGTPPDRDKALYWMEKADAGGHPAARRYAALLEASADGLLSPEDRKHYWQQQENYWIEMAAQFGVREAEEAVGNAPDNSGPDVP